MANPTFSYTAPFVTFVALMALGGWLKISPSVAYPLRTLAALAVWLLFSRHLIRRRPCRPLASVLVGVAVFLIWIGPDLLWPGYRHHWLFHNALTGVGHPTLEAGARGDFWILLFRAGGSTLVVPLAEELFWRGWLMRWLIGREFHKVPLGAFSASAFWITAVLFASEHGPFWAVGLAAGIAYNWWIVRTRNLTDCVLAHAVTNGCLAAYVLATGEWSYWM